MSTILKALRRLEDQKAGAAQRPLRDEVVLAPSRGRAGRGRALALGAGVAFAVLGALLLLWLRSAPPAELDATPSDVAAAPAVEPAPLAVAPEPPPEATPSFAPAPEAEDAGSAEPDFDIVRPDPAADPRPLAPPPLPRLAEEEAPAPTPKRVAPRRPAPVLEEEPLEEPRVAAVARAAAPVRVTRTQWHPDPDRRIAWVEVEGKTALREVREGERIGPYLVREIEPAAVLFSEGSVEVRREVGP
jgi:hypothetical protein